MSILAAVDGDTVPCGATAAGYDLAEQRDEELVTLHVMTQEKYDDLHSAMNDGDRGNGGISGAFPFQVDAPTASSDTHSRTSPTARSSQFPIDDAEHWAEKIARRVVEETLEDYENVTFEGRVGNPVDTILDEARRIDANYLVIGGRKRTPVGKAVFGSKTQSILLRTDLPVVTVMREA